MKKRTKVRTKRKCAEVSTKGPQFLWAWPKHVLGEGITTIGFSNGKRLPLMAFGGLSKQKSRGACLYGLIDPKIKVGNPWNKREIVLTDQEVNDCLNGISFFVRERIERDPQTCHDMKKLEAKLWRLLK